MKNLKKILSLVLCLMMAAVLLTGCSKSLKGEWELVDASDDEMREMIEEGYGSASLEFTKDEVTMTIKEGKYSESDTADYEVDGDKIIIKHDGGYEQEWEYKIKGKKLTISFDGEELIFERK